LYYFYKNFLLTLPQMFFAFSNAFSGTSIFEDEYIAWYNALITTWPIAAKTIFDHDINPKYDKREFIDQLPLLYYESQQGLNFRHLKFIGHIAYSLVVSCIVYFLPFEILKSLKNHDGLMSD
jgi:phospholipid-transporting ATPase